MADEAMRTSFRLVVCGNRIRIHEEIHPGYWAAMTEDKYPWHPVEFLTPPEARAWLDHYMRTKHQEWITYEELDYINYTRTPHETNQDLEGTNQRELPRDGGEQGDQETPSELQGVAVDELGGGGGEGE